MMKKISFLLLILFIIGCSDVKELKDSNVTDIFLAKLQSSPVEIYEKNNIPEWLKTKINEIEIKNSKDSAIVKVAIFQGEWNKHIVYFIRNNLNSCTFCEVYYENGEKIKWTTDKDKDNFLLESKNWKLIYEYGYGIF